MKYYSNEIVFRGYPDKVCDQISDALLDAYLKDDKNSRCGIEVMGGKGKIFITGEVTSNSNVNIKKIVKRVLKDIRYSTNYEIISNIGIQSPDTLYEECSISNIINDLKLLDICYEEKARFGHFS